MSSWHYNSWSLWNIAGSSFYKHIPEPKTMYQCCIAKILPIKCLCIAWRRSGKSRPAIVHQQNHMWNALLKQNRNLPQLRNFWIAYMCMHSCQFCMCGFVLVCSKFTVWSKFSFNFLITLLHHKLHHKLRITTYKSHVPIYLHCFMRRCFQKSLGSLR